MRVFCDSSTREACVIFGDGKPNILTYSGQVTVNVGEYQAVILALKHLQMWGSKGDEIFTDSELLVKQVSGEYKCKKAHLLPLRNKVRELVKELGTVSIKHIPRAENLAGWALEELVTQQKRLSRRANTRTTRETDCS